MEAFLFTGFKIYIRRSEPHPTSTSFQIQVSGKKVRTVLITPLPAIGLEANFLMAMIRGAEPGYTKETPQESLPTFRRCTTLTSFV